MPAKIKTPLVPYTVALTFSAECCSRSHIVLTTVNAPSPEEAVRIAGVNAMTADDGEPFDYTLEEAIVRNDTDMNTTTYDYDGDERWTAQKA